VNGASDEELLAAHLEGDRTAFGELMTRHERRIYGLCLRILGNREDAEDATQEAFIAALRRAAAFRREAAFSTWLYRIAVNAATDQGRRRGRARTVPLETQETGHTLAIVGDPSGVVATTLTVQAALRVVPEDFRVVLILCDLYGFGHAQAAEILGVPIGTVKSRVFRGRLALGEQLAEREARGGGSGTQESVATSEPAEAAHHDSEE
jgi:RNA polymerase sigma-70 factor (ECF subfamily)